MFGCRSATGYQWAYNEVGDRSDVWAYMRLCVSCHRRFENAVKMMQTPVASRWRNYPERLLRRYPR